MVIQHMKAIKEKVIYISR